MDSADILKEIDIIKTWNNNTKISQNQKWKRVVFFSQKKMPELAKSGAQVPNARFTKCLLK